MPKHKKKLHRGVMETVPLAEVAALALPAPSTPPEPHRLSSALLDRKVRVVVVGCGGNGSEIASGLPLLHQALLANGHPGGLDVVLMDGDIVTSTNTVRQPFATADIGHPKAVVLMNRLNAFWGLTWRALPLHLGPKSPNGQFEADIVIGCVDTRAGRAAIRDRLLYRHGIAIGSGVRYWLDLGNDASSGQFVLGMPQGDEASPQRLPTVAELYPETVDVRFDKDDDRPACSAKEALERQEPFINRTLAAHALALVARLFKYGEITHHGGVINLETGRMVPLPVSEDAWKRIRSVPMLNARRLASGRAS